ncbi:4Fe-4S ferredoxin [Achromatium sp. WMS3]|nr:4Fe-4S ferredoxin [Achromatium sp. WMS3]
MNNSPEPTDQSRRQFLGTAAGIATASVAPGVVLHIAQATSNSYPVTEAKRWGMLIDTNKCLEDCNACVQACNKEHGMDLIHKPEGQDQQKFDQQKPTWIRKVKLKDNLTGRVTNLPMLCQHCEKPPCVDVCPTGASFKRADGIVMVDRHICIGCRFCMMACPYHARSFIHENVEVKPTLTPRGKGCVESCNLCVTRLDEGGTTTACQDACAQAGHHAIIFGDLNDENSPVSKALQELPSRQIRADLNLNTGVRYSGV